MSTKATLYIVRFTARSTMPEGVEPFNLWGELREAMNTPSKFVIYTPATCFSVPNAPHPFTTQEVRISFIQKPSDRELSALLSRLEEAVRVNGRYSTRGLTALDAWSGFELTITRE